MNEDGRMRESERSGGVSKVTEKGMAVMEQGGEAWMAMDSHRIGWKSG